MHGIHKLNMVREEIDAVEMLYAQGDYYAAAAALTQVIEICSWSAYFRKLRAKSRMQLGDYPGAVSDMKSTTKLTSDDTQGYYELSKLLYELGQVPDSLK